MAELTFIQTSDGFYTAEFKAEGEFSLHIERAHADAIFVSQKSMENAQYAPVKSTLGNDRIIDIDVKEFIAPKWIQLKTKTAPTYAATNL